MFDTYNENRMLADRVRRLETAIADYDRGVITLAELVDIAAGRSD